MDVSSKTALEPKNDPEEMFDDLMGWLDQNGFIHIDQLGEEGNAYGVSLTQKGFAVLGSQPEGIDQPLGTKLKEAAATVGSEAKTAAIASLVGTVLGSAYSAISKAGA